MDLSRLSPMDLSENPALGILNVVLEGLRMARLALCGVHGELLEEPKGREAAAQAYAFALLSQMQALEDTIRSYGWNLEELPDFEEEDEEEDNAPF